MHVRRCSCRIMPKPPTKTGAGVADVGIASLIGIERALHYFCLPNYKGLKKAEKVFPMTSQATTRGWLAHARKRTLTIDTPR